jgi:uncharacterized protein (DUF433 family)
MRVVDHVQRREGEFFVGSTRVTLRSIIADWKRGRRPEQIAEDFPGVPLAAIYGAIAYYLERQRELDGYFREQDAATARDKAAQEAAHPHFFREMRARIARVRPSVQADLHAHGITPDSHAMRLPRRPRPPLDGERRYRASALPHR